MHERPVGRHGQRHEDPAVGLQRIRAQAWQPTANGSLLNPQSGLCLDDPGSSTTDGTQLQIYDCNGTNAQKWTLP
ncbi:RICIN domain-containing protein [Streptomyces noboritoensis]|uniref:RICIN domain-containing protein n=1 Tax=Streptomyces noboritoensis TaxID=67337 RepID=A0ABV6TEK4_9ACTN